jgi:serine/threonine protein kinase
MADPSPGTPLPDPFEGTAYRTVHRLGDGGLGELFVVEHLEIGRRFAAKALHPHLGGNPQVVDRLRLEGHALARLSHPNVISVEGCDTTPAGRPFLIMELLRGRTLAAELRERGFLPVGVAVDYAIQLLSALDAVHQIGVVHRDVKPDNVFLTETRDGRTLLKLTNFGVARVLPGAPPAAPTPLAIPTDTGALVGTPLFMSPEGAQGSRVDERADLYGAALVLYTMLAGRGPFDHLEGVRAVIEAQVTETPAPPSHYAREPVPSELDALVLRALHKDPNARPASAREFREHLERLAALLAHPAGWLETTQYERQTATPGESAAAPLAAHGSAAPDELQTRVPPGTPRRARAWASRLSTRTLAIAVVLAISGLIVSGMAVVGVAALLRGVR